MSLHFYTKKEEIRKVESLSNYQDLFKEYLKDPPSLNEALNEMFLSTGISDEKANIFTNDIISKSHDFLQFNFDLIHEEHPIISYYEALIIVSYKCEAIEPKYSPYKLMNINLNEENRDEGICRISKYFFLFLQALRKLTRYYPKQKYMYRCINMQVDLKEDYFNQKIIPYQKGVQKTFYGFISITSKVDLTYNLNGKKEEIKNATIFDIYGDFWGYDISPFNKLVDEEIILEPEKKFIVRNAIPPNKNEIIHIRCKIENSYNILENIIKPDGFRIIYKFDKRKCTTINLFGYGFHQRYQNICKIIYKNNEYNLSREIDVPNIKENQFEIILKGISKIDNFSYMFESCDNISSLPDISKLISSNYSYMFINCRLLSSLNDISKLNTSYANNLSYMFNNCCNLKYLPDISNWDTSHVINMSNMFNNCKSLLNLPNISKWDVSNVNDMSYMFNNCKSLLTLPDISKWNINNVKNMERMFYYCKSLSFLPNISKWKISHLTNIDNLFYQCESLISIPCNLEWTETLKGKDLISFCYSLTYNPFFETFENNINSLNKKNL